MAAIGDTLSRPGGRLPSLRIRALLVLVILVLAAGVWWYVEQGQSSTGSTIVGSGTIEADEVNLATETPGRLDRVLVEEGATVRSGDLLASLDSSLLDAQERQARAAVEVAQANLALVERGARTEEIRQAEANLAQAIAQRDTARRTWENARLLRDNPQELTARIDAARPQVTAAQARLDLLKQGSRAEVVAQAEASLRAAEALLQQLKNGPTEEQRRAAQQTVEAAKVRLHAANVQKDGDCGGSKPEYVCKAAEANAIAAQQSVDAAQSQYDALVAPPTAEQLAQAEASVEQARQQLALAKQPFTEQEIRQAEAALAQAEANLKDLLEMRDNPVTMNAQIDSAQGQYQASEAAVQAAQARLDQIKAGASEEQLAVARAQVKQAEAALGIIQTQKQKTEIRSPIDGYVSHVALKPGETASIGTRLVTIASLDNVKLTVYVAENKIGHVILGQKVHVTVDSFPGQSFEGEVIYVSPKAEFTPRNVQTQAERANTVFAVKVKIPNPDQKLKAGMAADARFGS